VIALESDRDQPIHIQADSAVVDENTGSSTYLGNVIIDQGSMHIEADEIRILTADDEVIQIIASANPETGKKARYQQQPPEANSPVVASAQEITYFVQEARLHLQGEALLQQVDDTFRGELLYYDVTRGIVNLNSGDSGQRVNMTLNPKKN